MTSSKSIDQLVFLIVNKKNCIEERKKYEERRRNFEEWIQRTLLGEVKAGQRIDIKDTEHVWCVGQVELKFTSKSRPPLLYIHYEGWSRKYDEYIYNNSKRLAPLGVYTNRGDIPRYQDCPNSNRYQYISHHLLNRIQSMLLQGNYREDQHQQQQQQ